MLYYRFLFTFMVFAIFCLTIPSIKAQEIDASKPTNFYSLLDNTLENTAHSSHNVFGYRGKILYAPSEAHLIMGEIPLLYNDQSSKFGLGDIRARYFYLPYKNYDKFIGAFGPSVDIFLPNCQPASIQHSVFPGFVHLLNLNYKNKPR